MSKLKLKKIKVSEASKADVMEGPSMFPPSFHVESKQMSEIENWEVGDKYKLIIEVKMKSKSDNVRGTSASLDIVAYRELKKKKPEDMNDKEFEDYQGKVLSGKERV